LFILVDAVLLRDDKNSIKSPVKDPPPLFFFAPFCEVWVQNDEILFFFNILKFLNHVYRILELNAANKKSILSSL
jgi:hypothetical protein